MQRCLSYGRGGKACPDRRRPDNHDGRIRKRDGLEVMITEKETRKAGARGDDSHHGQLQSVSVVLAPTPLARAYASAPGTARRFLCAVMTALSELVFGCANEEAAPSR